MTPLYKPKKKLTKGQLALMTEHKQHHTKKHMNKMNLLLKEGYCFQQAHTITMKQVGK